MSAPFASEDRRIVASIHILELGEVPALFIGGMAGEPESVKPFHFFDGVACRRTVRTPEHESRA